MADVATLLCNPKTCKEVGDSSDKATGEVKSEFHIGPYPYLPEIRLTPSQLLHSTSATVAVQQIPNSRALLTNPSSSRPPFNVAMAKSKKYVIEKWQIYLCLQYLSSHTNHNQSKKAHKNGIKNPQSNRTRSMKGVCTICMMNGFGLTCPTLQSA